MKGIEGIKERILSNAHEDAERLLEQAKQAAEAAVEKIDEQTKQSIKKLEQEGVQKIVQRGERLRSVAQLEGRKELLRAKQDMIECAFERAVEHMKAMPDAQYKETLSAMLLEAVSTGDEEVVFSSEDPHAPGADIIESVNSELLAQGRKAQLHMATKQNGFTCGFILKSGGHEINNSIEAIFRVAREDIEPEVADILFKEAPTPNSTQDEN